MEVPFYEMENLTIERENYLETLWHNDMLTSNSFCKLQNICIQQCHKLTYVFPSHMVGSLVFLNTLKVSNCELVERIFEIDREVIGDDVKVVPLTKLSLDRLPNLKYVWSNDPGELLMFPNLKEVDVTCCPRLKSVFPASFVKRMEEIESFSADGENEIFVEDETSKVVSPKIAIFPSLKNLEIHRKMVEKISFWVRSLESFPKLERLSLIGSEDEGDMINLPLEMSEVLYRIEEFKIIKAYELLQVFQNKHYTQSGVLKLKRLDLYDLPKLTHVWEAETEADGDAFDSLERIEICECESLKCVLPSSIAFFNLTYLEVSRCDGLMNLFSSSVAENLVNLETMKVLGCEGMTSIVGVTEGDREEIIFNKMKCLKLYDLPRLASFHSRVNGKCRLKFLELETLAIKRCPEMKVFSDGRIDTPKLTFLITEEGDIPVSEAYGINDIIKVFLTFESKEDSEEDIEEDKEE